MANNEQNFNQAMWSPYAFHPFHFAPGRQYIPGVGEEQAHSSVPIMNPLLSPMMVRGQNPYGALLSQEQLMLMASSGGNGLGEATYEAGGRLVEAAYEAGGHSYPLDLAHWQQQGFQPMIYPMMMMVPISQQQQQLQQQQQQLAYPDVVEDEFLDAVSDIDPNRAGEHDVTPDLLRATVEAEPTYMNEAAEEAVEEDQPSYANENLRSCASEMNYHGDQHRHHQLHHLGHQRASRAQSVQPAAGSAALNRRANNSVHLGARREKYSTYHTFSRTGREQQHTAQLRSHPLSRSLSTTSQFSATNRPPTLLHIPDIKPHVKKDVPEASTAPTSLFPFGTSNLRAMRSRLGQSLLSLKGALLGGGGAATLSPRPNPLTATTPRPPPRRKSGEDKRRAVQQQQLVQEETIDEVATPAETPTLPRDTPTVPRDTPPLPKGPDNHSTTDAMRIPAVPMPGMPTPSPTYNALEMIGSPVLKTRASQSEGPHNSLKEPVVAMPLGSSPADSVSLRQLPGRRTPLVPQPMGSTQLRRRSNRFSVMSSGTQFHSVISSDLFPLEDVAMPHTVNNGLMAAEANSSQPLHHDLPEDKDDDLHNSNAIPQQYDDIQMSASNIPLLKIDVASSWTTISDNNALQAPGLSPDTAVAAQQPPRPPSRHLRVCGTPSPSPSRRSGGGVSSSAYSDVANNVMSETREDLLQGIRAMDDSIQTLKAEMNKLLSVYESVCLQPEERAVTEAGPDLSQDQIEVESVTLPLPKSLTPLITEAGQAVLEVVGDEAVIRFKNFGANSVGQNAAHTSPLPSKDDSVKAESIYLGQDSTTESMYNMNLGVYHENEMAGQPTLSPGLQRRSDFKKKRGQPQNSKVFRRSFLGIEKEGSADVTAAQDEANCSDGEYSEVDLTDVESSQQHSNAAINSNNNGATEQEQKDIDPKDEEQWEIVSSTTDTLDVTLDVGEGKEQEEKEDEQEEDEDEVEEEEEEERAGNMTIQEFLDETKTVEDNYRENDDIFNDLMSKSAGSTWEDLKALDAESDLPPPLLLQENLRSLKLDLLSSIFQGLYPTEGDCQMVRHFITCPASLEEKYHMMRFADLLKRNKKDGVSLETLSDAMSQLGRIGQELMKPELERDPIWRSIPCAKEILVQKGIAERAPWELIQGGSEILESLGYTEYTGFALQYPRNIIPDMFADHIGNLTVELVLASAEVTSLILRRQPSLPTLVRLLEVQPFPGMEPQTYYPDVPMLEEPAASQQQQQQQQLPPRSSSAMSGWIKKPPLVDADKEDILNSNEVDSEAEHTYDQEEDSGSMNGARFRHRTSNESEYEEIGPPKHRNGAISLPQTPCDLCGSPNALLSCSACHMQSFCAACDDMYHKHPRRSDHVRKPLKNGSASSTFHPSSVPAVEMPGGSGPKAPPRRNARRERMGSSVEPSPAPSRTVSGTRGGGGTLPRQPASHMQGRPLPPPPPPNQHTASSTPPPILPKKSASLAQMSSLGGAGGSASRPAPRSIPMPGSSSGPRDQWASSTLNTRKSSSGSSSYPVANPPYPSANGGYPSRQEAYPTNNAAAADINPYPGMANPAYPMHGGAYPRQTNSAYPGGNICYPTASPLYPQTKYPSAAGTGAQRFPGSGPPVGGRFNGSVTSLAGGGAYPLHSPPGGAVRGGGGSLGPAMQQQQQPFPSMYPAAMMATGGPMEDWGGVHRAGWPAQQQQSSYHEEMQFPPQAEQLGAAATAGRRTAAGQSSSRSAGRGRFANRVNRSSSLHDLARMRLDPTSDSGEGVKWKDEVQNVNAFPGMPGMGGLNGFQRTTSTKSLHLLGSHQAASDWGGQQGPTMPGVWGGQGGLGYPLPAQGQFASLLPGWGPVPGVLGPMPMGGAAINRSLHELGKGYLRPSSPSGSQKSTRSKNSNRSKKSNASRRSKTTRQKERRSRTNSSSQSRNASRNSKKNRDRSASTNSEDFYTGESDEEFVSISSNSDKAPRVSWTCEHCTYVNNPGVKVCSMCCKTSKQSREMASSREEQSSNRNSLKRDKSSKGKQKKKSGYASSDSDTGKRRGDNKNNGSGKTSKKYAESSDSEDERQRRRKKEKERKTTTLKKGDRHSRSDDENSDIDEAIAAYYAVRIDKNQGMTVAQTYADSSSESASAHNPLNRPNPDAPAPAKGILKKAVSNPSLAKLDTMSEAAVSEAGGTISEVGYITNKLTERLRARGAIEAMDPVLENNRRTEAMEDAWRKERESWHRQKEALKAWAQSQGRSQEGEASPRIGEKEPELMQEGRMYRTLSGHSLAEHELTGPNFARRGSEQVMGMAGKKNFRSKRFSRNLEREPVGLKRAQSFHMDQRQDGDLWLDAQRRHFYRTNSRSSLHSEQFGGGGGPLGVSDSSEVEEPLHFTSTVTSSTRGPGGIGSYLARREFGSSEVQPGPDSGYVSHSSGGGYPKLQVQNSNSIRSFTMSVDRGFLGVPSKPVLPTVSGSEFSRFRSMDDLAGPKEPINAVTKTHGFELVKILREAELSGFTSEDIQVAVNHCGDTNPVDWLSENWANMIETVMTLASNVGHEANENIIGTISKQEARAALREHKGNIWAAVTECVETRQQKYEELMSKGNFAREDAVTMLTAHEGNVDAAFQELNKAQLKPFLLRIWGQAEGQESADQPPANREGSTEGEAFEDAADEEGVRQEEEEDAAGLDQPEPVKPISPEQMKFERQVRRLLAEGKVNTFQEGELVLRIMEAGHPEDEALLAVSQAEELQAALALLNRECELCTANMNIKEVVRMVSCDHCCCRDCAKNFFSVVIMDQNISQAVCPFCREPSNLAEDDDIALAYYARLDILLKDTLEKDTHDLFQRKLRDRTLMKDPNFKWCFKCPFGFLSDPKNKKLVCPDCRAMSCAKCEQPWEPQHEGISCQDFARWKEENDPDRQAAGLEEHLAQHGISCPACNFRYTLTRGGCMHFTCSQCKFEFCIGCRRPFKLGTKCGRDASCAKMGLHAHHPRNCLFYLRDKEPADLQKLLKKNKVEYLTELPVDAAQDGGIGCRVQVQKESPNGMVDGVCGEPTPGGQAGYCTVHYVEYLCGLIIQNKLEVVSLLELGEVKAVFTRAGKFIPNQRPGEYEFQYLRRLAQVVEQEIPLDAA